MASELLLHDAERSRRNSAYNGARKRGRDLDDGLSSSAARGQPDSQSLLCVDLPSRQDHLGGAMAPDAARQQRSAQRRNDAMPKLRRDKSAFLANDDQIAGERKLQSSACREALNCRNGHPRLFSETAKEMNRIGFRRAAIHPS